MVGSLQTEPYHKGRGKSNTIGRQYNARNCLSKIAFGEFTKSGLRCWTDRVKQIGFGEFTKPDLGHACPRWT